MPTDHDADLALAHDLADDADVLALDRFRAVDLAVSAKPDLSLVSDADQAVEQAIRRRLAAERPGDAVSGEEYGSQGTGSRRWVIDPIDGTHSYVRGVPVWATLIALLDDDVPVLGVVSAPALGRRWWATIGGGAWSRTLGGEPRAMTVSHVASLADANLSYSSVTGWGNRRGAFLGLLDQVWRTRAYGDFWSYMMVAEGVVDLAAEPELSLWDMAALAPIVTEAGGRFSGVDGIDGIHEGSAVASNGLLHELMITALAVD